MRALLDSAGGCYSRALLSANFAQHKDFGFPKSVISLLHQVEILPCKNSRSKLPPYFLIKQRRTINTVSIPRRGANEFTNPIILFLEDTPGVVHNITIRNHDMLASAANIFLNELCQPLGTRHDSNGAVVPNLQFSSRVARSPMPYSVMMFMRNTPQDIGENTKS